LKFELKGEVIAAKDTVEISNNWPKDKISNKPTTNLNKTDKDLNRKSGNRSFY